MNGLNPSMVLHRDPHLRLRLDGGVGVVVTGEDGTETRCGRHALVVLEQFSQPTSVGDGLKSLQTRVRGSQEWIELTATIVQLYDGGILRDTSRSTPQIGVRQSGFESAQIHVAMLNDRERTASFIEALRATVRPSDVVVDIGTGTGVLATAAAMAGARRVFALEMGPIGHLAQKVFEANGVADRVTLIHGRSTEIELPERADVLVSEIIGNEPLGEQVLEIFRDARLRLLRPDARYVPSRLRILGFPVEVPRAEVDKRFFGREAVDRWAAWYGIDFEPLLTARAVAGEPLFLSSKKVMGWQSRGDAAVLADIDLTTISALTVDNLAEVAITQAGRVNGLVVYFELSLGHGIVHCTDPRSGNTESSWHTPVYLLPSSPSVEVGDRFRISYRYRLDSGHATVNLSPAGK